MASAVEIDRPKRTKSVFRASNIMVSNPNLNFILYGPGRDFALRVSEALEVEETLGVDVTTGSLTL